MPLVPSPCTPISAIRERIEETHHSTSGSSIDRTETEIGARHFPDDFGLEDDGRLRPSQIVLSSRAGLERLHLGISFVEEGVAEAGAQFANRLEAFGVRVVRSEEESAIGAGTLALTGIGADDDEVERVAHTSEVVLFNLGAVVKDFEAQPEPRRRTLSQFILRLLGSYVDPSPSSILTINPSQESLILSSRNS